MILTDVKTIVNDLYAQAVQGDTMDTINNMSCVDIGKALANADISNNLYRDIIDRVGRYVQKNKIYRAKLPSVLRDSWEWGALKETIRVKPFQAVTDPMRRPSDGTSYLEGFKYHKASTVSKYFDTYDDFQFVWTSENYETLWSAFNSWEELNRFFNGIEASIVSSREKRIEQMIMNTINNMIGVTAADALGTGTDYGAISTLRFQNILKMWNDSHDQSNQFATAEAANQSKDYLKFKYLVIENMKNRFSDLTNLLNIDGEDVFTTQDDLTLILLSTQANNMKVNLESDTFHNDLVSLKNYETVSYWQGTGSSYAESDISKINVKVKTSGTDTTGTTVTISGIVGVMFDRNALGVNCERKKTTSQYIAEIDRFNYFDKYQAQYFNDTSENFVVFVEIPETVTEEEGTDDTEAT